MELVSINNNVTRLTTTLSRRLISVRLAKVALFCAFCLSALALVLLSSGTSPFLSMVIKQPLLLVLVLPTTLLLIFTIKLICVFYSGETFSFDRNSDSIQYNSRKVAALSDLREVQIRRPTFSTEKVPRNQVEAGSETALTILRSMPESLRLWEWPSIWLTFSNRRPIQLLNTTELMPIRVWLLKVNFASQQEVEQHVIAVATEIAMYTGAVLYDETKPKR